MAIQSRHDRTVEKLGDMLRRWRKARRYSQMELAAAAHISTRHLSFIETGRAQPGYDVVLSLASVLDLPLRHVNALLVAAGYAPRFTQWSLEDDATGMVTHALRQMLTQHDPYPAFVVNRAYDVVMHNDGVGQLVAWLSGDVDMLARHTNTYRLMFAPDGLRPYVVDWTTLQSVLLKRLHDESLAYQSTPLADLYTDCVAMVEDGITVDHGAATFDPQLPVVTLDLCKNDTILRFFSTVTTFGTAIDVTVQELRIEALYPADDATRRLVSSLGDVKSDRARWRDPE